MSGAAAWLAAGQAASGSSMTEASAILEPWANMKPTSLLEALAQTEPFAMLDLSKLTWHDAEAAIVLICVGSWKTGGPDDAGALDILVEVGALDILERAGQAVFNEMPGNLSWSPCDKPLPMWWELNHPLDLAGKWKMGSWMCMDSV